ncbi:GntR family transcriptional regulator [Nitrincola tapanii]|uniref:GntR family transcriptional regulator n=1 Tax=Nitrincola tapanii TaxID=1708751 RepID=A0A5A9W6S0_9GAMM|nr:GntR family transcriptional regulator [Nitrincola tapanii]KAA0876416.1 GntR family transcriptional regulator [Nitrincola tapanii]
MQRARVKSPRQNLADRLYQQIKELIFNFQLLPGEYFSEAEIAQRFQASRTPVREALYRLQQEQYVEVHFRSGWQVKPFDFKVFEELYDLRILLECSAIERLCSLPSLPDSLQALTQIWCLSQDERRADLSLCEEDREFHHQLLAAAGNGEMTRIHTEISERIHIIRRLDFTQPERIQATYDEHAAILSAIQQADSEQAKFLLQTHIRQSRDEVRKITLHRLQEAQRQQASSMSI